MGQIGSKREQKQRAAKRQSPPKLKHRKNVHLGRPQKATDVICHHDEFVTGFDGHQTQWHTRKAQSSKTAQLGCPTSTGSFVAHTSIHFETHILLNGRNCHNYDYNNTGLHASPLYTHTIYNHTEGLHTSPQLYTHTSGTHFTHSSATDVGNWEEPIELYVTEYLEIKDGVEETKCTTATKTQEMVL